MTWIVRGKMCQSLPNIPNTASPSNSRYGLLGPARGLSKVQYMRRARGQEMTAMENQNPHQNCSNRKLRRLNLQYFVNTTTTDLIATYVNVFRSDLEQRKNWKAEPSLYMTPREVNWIQKSPKHLRETQARELGKKFVAEYPLQQTNNAAHNSQ